MNLTQAAEESGYSDDHLGRLVKDGTIPNAGRPGAPLIRRGLLPRKAGVAQLAPIGDTVGANREQIARDIVQEGIV